MTEPVLRDYQAEAERRIYAAWQSGARNVLLVLPTGAGKTVTFADIMRRMNGACVAIAHRQELVSQVSLALARYNVRHRIIGQPQLIRDCVNLHGIELGNTFYNATSHVAAAGVDTLIRRNKNDPIFQQTRLWVCDECFPAGTIVDGRPIETLRVGDMVTAFDEMTGMFHQRAITRVFKNVAPTYMMQIVTGRHVITCTKEHPIWTKRGWVAACNITTDDEIMSYDASMHELRTTCTGTKRYTAIPLEENRTNFLLAKMRLCPSRPTSRQVAEAPTSEKLHGLWDADTANIAPHATVQADRSGVLQQGMQHRVSSAGVVSHNGTNEQTICVCSNDDQQSNAQCRNTHEGCKHLACDTAQADVARRKWETAERGRSCSVNASFLTRVSSRHCDPNENAARVGIPDGLQTRPCEPVVTDSHRDRRKQSLRNEPEGTGRKENCIPNWHRVESAEIYQRTSNDATDDGFVYNLEVDEFHTYVANGIVVHNCHHLVDGNKWQTAVEMFPNAYGLGVTATPLRADGKGLGRHHDGVMDVMIVGPSMRDLIYGGYLTEYRVFAPPNDLDLSDVNTSASGDYSPEPLRKAVHRSHIHGDIVAHYMRIAPGKLGVTFAVDVESAVELAQAFKQQGIPAEAVSAKTPDNIRFKLLRMFAAGELKQLVNVDLFGEGFDLPAIEVCSMGRPTKSFGLYTQQFGRALRPMDGKQHAIIIDHVGNVMLHGLPDSPRSWTLDRRERRSKNTMDDEPPIPLRACPTCAGVYERSKRICPYCNAAVEPSNRSAPEFVDGDLSELTPDVLARMRGEIDANLELRIPYGAAPEVVGALKRHHRERVEAQTALRNAMALWGGIRTAQGISLEEAQREFYLRYGIDVATAQTLNAKDALALMDRITR